jgi:hypothetical protein
MADQELQDVGGDGSMILLQREVTGIQQVQFGPGQITQE